MSLFNRKTFEYTDTKPVTSTAVDAVFYNSETKKLAVFLHGEVYVYSGVPKERYENLVDASSVGRAFREVKADYGRSDYLGRARSVEPVLVSVPAPDMGAVGTPKGLTYAADAKVTGDPAHSRVRVTLGEVPVPEGVKYKHAVYFKVNPGDLDFKIYNTEAGSVHEAVEALTEAALALDLNVTVKEVRVYFE